MSSGKDLNALEVTLTRNIEEAYAMSAAYCCCRGVVAVPCDPPAALRSDAAIFLTEDEMSKEPYTMSAKRVAAVVK